MINKANDPKGEAGSKKCPLGLIPPSAMEETAWVHRLGAEKYSDRTPINSCPPVELVLRYCSCGLSTEHPYATQNDLTLHKDYVSSAIPHNAQKSSAPPATEGGSHGRMAYVSPAMINNYGSAIPNMPHGSDKLPMIGLPKITDTSERSPVGAAKAPLSKNDLEDRIGRPNFPDTDSTQKMNPESCPSREGSVPSAKGLRGSEFSTSTTATLPESSVDSCATDATKVSVYLGILHRLLKQHSPICDSRKLRFDGKDIVFPGDFNWRRTSVCASTYVHAILRHLNAWRDGEDLDPESGRTHLAHIACCCNILMDASACGKLDDDRNKIGHGDPEVEAEIGVEPPTTQGPYAGYRMLDKGEILQEGDVVYHASWGPMDTQAMLLLDKHAGKAIAFSSNGPYPHGYYFRPVQNDKQPTTEP